MNIPPANQAEMDAEAKGRMIVALMGLRVFVFTPYGKTLIRLSNDKRSSHSLRGLARGIWCNSWSQVESELRLVTKRST